MILICILKRTDKHSALRRNLMKVRKTWTVPSQGGRAYTVVEMKSIFFKKACKFNEGPKKIPF